MKYYIIAASKDHVQKGVAAGFAQAGHGKKGNLKKLQKDDWVIYYSSKEKIDDKKPFQKFTAIGQVADDDLYQKEVSKTFQPWRRNVHFYNCRDLDIRPLLDDFEFITNRKKWGLHLMGGFLQITKADFERIAQGMLLESDKILNNG